LISIVWATRTPSTAFQSRNVVRTGVHSSSPIGASFTRRKFE
jgi:hypothetical protein